MWSRILVLALFCSCAVAQTSAPASPANPAIDNEFVHRQFGDSCTLEAKWAPMTADLNGDGVADLVMVARCKNPLIDQDDKDYRVIDPLDSFFGYGNTKVTSGFGQDDPRLHGLCLLVIHGAGADSWHSAAPQAKFVIINLAVNIVSVKKLKINKKKTTTAIYVEESTGEQMTAAIFWDGKKYRYEPLGSSLE